MRLNKKILTDCLATAIMSCADGAASPGLFCRGKVPLARFSINPKVQKSDLLLIRYPAACKTVQQSGASFSCTPDNQLISCSTSCFTSSNK